MLCARFVFTTPWPVGNGGNRWRFALAAVAPSIRIGRSRDTVPGTELSSHRQSKSWDCGWRLSPTFLAKERALIGLCYMGSAGVTVNRRGPRFVSLSPAFQTIAGPGLARSRRAVRDIQISHRRIIHITQKISAANRASPRGLSAAQEMGSIRRSDPATNARQVQPIKGDVVDFVTKRAP